MSDEETAPSRFIHRVSNGAIGGLVGTSLIYPLDFGKTRMQNQTRASAGGASATQYKNVVDVVIRTSKANGILSVYKGLAVNLVFVMPEKAIKLSVNDQLRHMFGGQTGKFLSLDKELSAGALAGFCQVVVTTPMELLKIQMQVAIKEQKVGASANPSAFRIAQEMIKTGGIGSLYKGLQATLFRDVPFSAIYFPLFAYINSKGLAEGQKTPPFYHTLVSGLAAGSVSSFLVTPMDVVKTRLQVIEKNPDAVKYKGMWDCVCKTARNDGLKAFFRGSVARVSVIAPLFGIAQMVYFLGIAEKIFGVFGH